MLDISLVLFTVLVALLLRTEPLRRLRPLTAPLVLTAAAALAHFLSGALVSPAGVVAQFKRHLLRFVGR